MSKWDSQYYVYGPNTSNGQMHLWMCPSKDYAKALAEKLCRDTGQEVLLLEKLGKCSIEMPVVWSDEKMDVDKEASTG